MSTTLNYLDRLQCTQCKESGRWSVMLQDISCECGNVLKFPIEIDEPEK